MNIVIAPAAETFIRRMLRFGGGMDHGFRLVVSPGGCSGLSAEFSVESAPFAGDAVVEWNGMKLFLPAESRVLLEGATVDFTDTPTQTGLVFHQPGGSACGCSSSAGAPGLATVEIGSITRKH
ncbi:MAG: iron-sulfur cluster assembly accessory protein [Gammaproteobacteria bacterium]|nr:iron-sulfur cluster assembly accessory protein [Gammaproteobacteria bacterium]